MSLSRALPKGIVGSSFGRSISCEDLSFAPPSAGKDGIQLLLKAGNGRGGAPPVRMLASETITSVNVRVKGPSRGFYTKQQCIVSGLDAAVDDDALLEVDSPSERMCLVLSLSDLLQFSACTAESGQAFAFSPETQGKAPATPNANRILEEPLEEDVDDEGQLVLAAGEVDSLAAFPNLLRSGNLYLLADRTQSKVYIRPSSQGASLELSVQYAPVLSSSTACLSPPSLESGQRKLLGGGPGSHAPAAAPQVELVEGVRQGLASGFAPQLTEEGSGGTYWMPGASGSKVAVFKPMDEEPLAMNCPRGMTPSKTGEGLKRGTRVGEGAFREVAAFLLDRPAAAAKASSSLDEAAHASGFSGVPLTMLARCDDAVFSRAGSASHGNNLFPSLASPASKLGSLQQFVSAVSNCEDMGPKDWPKQEVHKICVLDMRLANTDRNGANILVQKNGSSFNLVPIDHGYCLPETLEELTFEWLYWSQSKEQFDDATLEYIASLDAEEDLRLLSRCGWNVSEGVATTLRACTMLLKKGAARGMTAFDIGSLMVREDFSRPSELEEMVEEAEARVDRQGLSGVPDFVSALGSVMDEKLAASR